MSHIIRKYIISAVIMSQCDYHRTSACDSMPYPTLTIPLEPANPTITDKVIVIVQLLYGVPSFILMVVMFFVIGLSKSYKNSFYRLVQLDLATNIITYINTWPAVRMAKHPFGVMILRFIESMAPGLLTMLRTVLNFFLHMQFCSTAALSLHRISSVVFYKRYEKNWSRYYPLYIVCCIFYSTIPLLGIHRCASEVSIINGTLTATNHLDVFAQLLFLNAVCSVIYFILILTLGLMTAVMVSKVVKTYSKSDRGLSKKLTRIALTYCTLYIGVLIWSLVRSIDAYFPFLPALFTTYKMEVLMFSSDLITLALPYILLVFDTNVRNDVAAKKKSTISLVMVSIAPSAAQSKNSVTSVVIQ